MRLLLILLLGGLAGCTSVPVVRYASSREAVRIRSISAEKPNELHFEFLDNVALFWRVDLKESYFRHDTFEKFGIVTRPGYNADGSKRGMDLYISRSDHGAFVSGRYSFHLVLRSEYRSYPRYRVRDILTGSFSIHYGLTNR